MLADLSLDVVALGELLVDFATVDERPDGYPVLAAQPGGAPTNFLAALAKMGAKTALIAKVGEDAFGHLLRRTVAGLGIDIRGVSVDPEVFTTLAFVTLDAKGEREFSFARKPGADMTLRPEEVPLTLIDRARAFHFGSLSLTDEPARSATRLAVEHARRTGKLVSFDPNLRPPLWRSLETARAQMLWGMERADVVKLSEEEGRFLFHCGPQETAGHVLALGPKLVFVTLGREGCLAADGASKVLLPTLPGIQVADTTGAGDIFGGTALWQLLRTGKSPGELTRRELEYIAAFACTAASLSTQKPGGVTSVPEPADILSHFTR